jgi:hypothetical protein
MVTRTKKRWIAVIASALLVPAIPGHAAEAPAGPVEARCDATYVGGRIVVSGYAVAPDATSVALTCHVWSGPPFYDHVHVAGTGGGSTAVAAGSFFWLSPFPPRVCAEVHALFLTGGAYHISCPAH